MTHTHTLMLACRVELGDVQMNARNRILLLETCLHTVVITPKVDAGVVTDGTDVIAGATKQ